MRIDRSLLGQAARFGIAGAANTALTVLAYQALLLVLPATASYAIAWALGLLFVALVYPSKVFRARDVSLLLRAKVIGVYLVGFLLGLAIVAAIEARWEADRLAIFAALAVTTVFNFLAMRAVTRTARDRPARGAAP